MRENFYCQVSVIADITLNGTRTKVHQSKLLAWGETPELAQTEGHRMAQMWIPELTGQEILISDSISA